MSFALRVHLAHAGRAKAPSVHFWVGRADITQRKEVNWAFVPLGANQDDFKRPGVCQERFFWMNWRAR